MIGLKKIAKPQILVDEGGQWTEEVMSNVYNGLEIPNASINRYRHPEIKEQVKVETSEKCIYCESKVSHTYPGDIEHIIPKSKYPRLAFTWSNLTYVCFWCNNNKRAFLSRETPLLNPYKDDIKEHLRAFGPILFHTNGSARGELTHKKIKLNRKELRDRRFDAISDLQNLLDKYIRETDPDLKDILKNELFEMADKQKEYAFFMQQYLEDNGITK